MPEDAFGTRPAELSSTTGPPRSRDGATRAGGSESERRSYEYNSKGHLTRESDPSGRETLYEYDTNEIDLLRVKVKNGAGYDLVQTTSYNSQHQPLSVTDAANETTTYAYTASGQIATVTTPARAGITEERTTSYTYESGTDRLLTVSGPGGVMTSYTYDGYGRLRTTTDTDNYTSYLRGLADVAERLR
jgi:YD repeat-containing protein